MRISPFRAVRPQPDKADHVASVPYDVVNRDEAAALAAGNPISFLHVVRPDIDLPADTDPYADQVYEQARTAFQQLRHDNILIQEAEPALYLYRQVMAGRAQIGLVCCCHVQDYEQNLIKKHERTRQAKEDDRTRHVLTLNANAGPVFLTYRSLEPIDRVVADVTAKTDPLYDFVAPDGVQHTVWKTDPAQADAIVTAFTDVPCTYVADGHHRAASAWRAGQQRKNGNPDHTGNEEYNWFLTVLFPADQLCILPYNRVVRDLNGLSSESIIAQLAELGTVAPVATPDPAQPGTFCMYLAGQWYQITVADAAIDRSDPVRSLDVAILQERVLQPLFNIEDPRTDERVDFIGGIRGVKALEQRVDQDGWGCAFLMYPTTVEQLMAVADADCIMPPKSTWFEPKLRSGLLVHLLD
ncbi:MAG: DUF1015 domain-containing protein [Planctomycetes bacterium]|nr:DUF1015 domain-containing protein [Planctomycetota bacterium]NOG54664.1 DUF1015 domain-containing protein [Planctomycetota bacterium]